MTKTTTIRRNSAVRIIDACHDNAGALCFVRSVSKAKHSAMLVLASAPTGIELPFPVSLNALALDREVSANALETLRLDALAAKQQREDDRKEREVRRFAQFKARYISERREVEPELVRTRHDHGEDRTRIEYSKRISNDYYETRITVYDRPAWNGVPDVHLNWSALGNVSPEEALSFATALAAAAGEAIALREQRERALFIVV